MNIERSRLPAFPPGTICSREWITHCADWIFCVPGRIVPGALPGTQKANGFNSVPGSRGFLSIERGEHRECSLSIERGIARRRRPPRKASRESRHLQSRRPPCQSTDQLCQRCKCACLRPRRPKRQICRISRGAAATQSAPNNWTGPSSPSTTAGGASPLVRYRQPAQ